MSSMFKDTSEIMSEFSGRGLPMGWARQVLLGWVQEVVGWGGPSLSTSSQGLMAPGWAEMGFWAMGKDGGKTQGRL